MQKSNVGAISSKNKCNLVTRVGAISLFSVNGDLGGGTSRVRAAIFLVEQMQPSSFCPLIAPLFPLHLPQISAKSINYLLSYALTPYFYGTEGGTTLSLATRQTKSRWLKRWLHECRDSSVSTRMILIRHRAAGSFNGLMHFKVRSFASACSRKSTCCLVHAVWNGILLQLTVRNESSLRLIPRMIL